MLDELEALLPDLSAAIERRRLGEGLARLATLMRDSHRETARLNALLDIADMTDAVSDHTFAEALADVVEVVTVFERHLADSATAEDLKHAYADYQEVQKSLARLDRATHGFWRRSTAPFSQMIGFGTLLQKIHGLEQLGQDFVACGQAALNIRSDITADAFRDEIVRVRMRKASLEASRDKLVEDPEINVFLVELSVGRAKLRLVTDQVRAWLDRHGALDTFVVIAAS